jgi:TonB family protein
VSAPAAAADDDAACVSLQTAAGPGSVELVDPSADALRAARLAVASGPPVIVAAGARIWSRDGHDAGVVAREHGFDTPIAVAGARTCLARPVAVGDELPLCFDARDLRNAPTVAPVPLGARRIVGKLRQPKPSVGGGLDRDIVRRIVRARLNEVRHCYNQVLASDASLVGKIAVHFTIDADGSVFDSNVASASPGTEAVAECAASVVRRWLFPRTESGAAVPVTQAFELQGV